MTERVLMKGNEAIAEAAIAAGCDAYFGYPITPQAEILEWMARRMPEEGRVFIQAESELGAINMALGAASTGARVLVSSSGPGISLMAEAMSYMAGSELPMVLINVMRGGPGLGSIQPSQSDYFQATKGHGHGDYRVPVLAPSSIAEAIELVPTAFEIAERYRTPVMILTDGTLGQAMEPIVPRFRALEHPTFDWALTGADGRPPRVVRSLHLQADDLEAHNLHLQAKFRTIEAAEVRWAGEGLGRRRDRHRRLWHVRPRGHDRHGPGAVGRPARRPLPAHQPVAVPVGGPLRTGARACGPSWSSRCRPGRWSRTSDWPSRVGCRCTSMAGWAASCRRRARSCGRSRPPSSTPRWTRSAWSHWQETSVDDRDTDRDHASSRW